MTIRSSIVSRRSSCIARRSRKENKLTSTAHSRCDDLVGGDDFAPSLRNQDGLLSLIIVGDHCSKTVCCTLLTSLAPNLIQKIERLASYPSDAARHCNLLSVVEGLLIVKLQPRQNDAVRPG